MTSKMKSVALSITLYFVSVISTVLAASASIVIDINDNRVGIQQDAEVVGLPNGNFAVCWESEIQPNDEDIYFAIFQEDGTKVGKVF